jgi:hypothetical protein
VGGATVKERPILFSGQMVRALLAGRKTQTRRVLRTQPVRVTDIHASVPLARPEDWVIQVGPCSDLVMSDPSRSEMLVARCPHGQRGDRLWVRETWAHRKGNGITPVYRADADPPLDTQGRPIADAKWGPSIFMPRKLSRITLEVTEVRVQRVQDISDDDARAEGIYGKSMSSFAPVQAEMDARPAMAFALLWNSINGKRPGCAWTDNPWVWCISFRRIPGQEATS